MVEGDCWLVTVPGTVQAALRGSYWEHGMYPERLRTSTSRSGDRACVPCDEDQALPTLETVRPPLALPALSVIQRRWLSFGWSLQFPPSTSTDHGPASRWLPARGPAEFCPRRLPRG